jgi:hypothetical protein
MPGGFYSKYVPAAVLSKFYGELNAQGIRFNYYFHPFEHSPVGENKRLLKYSSAFASLYAANLGRHARQLEYLARRFSMSRLDRAYESFMPDALVGI